jgi:hypothetical protein
MALEGKFYREISKILGVSEFFVAYKIIKFLFEFFTKEHKFDFPKNHQYTCT